MTTRAAGLLAVLVSLAACGAVANQPDAGGPMHTLTVTRDGTGSGAVTSSPAGIDCGSTCSASFDEGSSVTLTATPTGDGTFSGWGGACSGTGSCTVTMTQATSVSATFTSGANVTLTVAIDGFGGGAVTSNPGTINCPGTCTGSFAPNTNVTLTAGPTSGSVFAGWQGGCTGMQATCAVTLDMAKTVTATFQPAFCATGRLDNFNVANTTTIPNWTERQGDWVIENNRAHHGASGGVYTNVMTRDNSTLTDGCASVAAVATPVMNNTIQAVGVVLRWTAPNNYVVGLVQDNTNSGAFNTMYIYQYPGGSSLGTASFALGQTPRVQFCVQGTALTLKADANNDGTYEGTLTATTNLAGAGLVGTMTHTFTTQALVDDFCVGQ